MRTSTSPHDVVSIPFIVTQLLGKEVAAIAIVCSVAEGQETSVVAFITPGSAARSPQFKHAIEMEHSYSDTLLGFDAAEEPVYETSMSLNLRKAARSLGVDRLLCMVTLDAHGNVAAVRDYDGLEVTALEAASTQFDRFKEILETVATPRSSRLQ